MIIYRPHRGGLAEAMKRRRFESIVAESLPVNAPCLVTKKHKKIDESEKSARSILPLIRQM